MRRLLLPAHPSPAPDDFAAPRRSHPLLSGFPLAVMMVGALLVLFALTMTLSADPDGAGRASSRVSPVVGSVATAPVTINRL
jgi:hypothetical protein